MKPLTAEDLVIGGKYVVQLYSPSEVCEYIGFGNRGYLFKKYPMQYFLNEEEISTCVTPYTEPNECCHLGCNDCPYEESTMMELTSLHEPTQTTMNTEVKSKMQ